MHDVTTAVAEGRPFVLRERYEILGVLGEGAMGIVYRARDRELDRVVAIKTLDGASGSDDRGASGARLQQEASAAARLSHAGIVTIYDVGVGDGVPYIVMEYFKGQTLSALLAEGPLPPEKAVLVVVQVCRALQYAHAEGVVHRDIKSSNIMVDAAWRVKLTDFGVARVVGRRASDTMIVGTPAYIAPEHAQGGEADARSDLFSLGVVLYEALTGERPFPSEDFTAVLHEVVHLDPVPARERNFAVSPALDAVVRRVMSKDPDDRYPDAGTFADALSQALADGPGALAFARAWGRTGRRRAAVLVVAAAAVTAGAGAWLVPGERHAPVAPVIVEEREQPPLLPPPPPPPSVPTVPPAPRPPVAVARTAAPAAPVVEQPPAAAPATAKTACLSVNAVPFATVYVDGRALAETPRACVRIALGRHRVVFESMNERSPEETIVIDEQHTAEAPLRVSYDFRIRQFLAR